MVSGEKHEPRLRARLHEAMEPRRDSVSRAVSVAFGLWPVFAIFGMMLAFAWGFAMFQSP